MTLRDTPRATVSGWLRWLLVLSLALNMLVIGAVASAWLRHGGPEVRHARTAGIGGPLTQALTPDDRRAIGREIRQRLRDDASLRRDMRGIQEGVIAALRTEPFDPAPVRVLLTRQISLGAKRDAIAHDLLIGRVGGMSRADRLGYADRLEEALRTRDQRRLRR